MLLKNSDLYLSNAYAKIGILGTIISENYESGFGNSEIQKKQIRKLVSLTKELRILLKYCLFDTTGQFIGIVRITDAEFNKILNRLIRIGDLLPNPIYPKLLFRGQPDIKIGSSVGTPGLNGVNSYTFIRYASDENGGNFSSISGSILTYIGFITKQENVNPTASEFSGLWVKYIGANGQKGDTGNSGVDGSKILYGTVPPSDTEGANGDLYIKTSGQVALYYKISGAWSDGVSLMGGSGDQGIQGLSGVNAYLYIAWADSTDGTGFTTTFNQYKSYIAVKQSTTVLTPTQGTFTGLWARYRGYDGDRWTTTSQTTLTIGTGLKVLTIGTGYSYIAGQGVIVSIDNTTNYMSGTVVSYADELLTIQVNSVSGSGVQSNLWKVSLYYTTSLSTWNLGGNSGTSIIDKYIGTSDDVGLIIKTNNATRVEIYTDGTSDNIDLFGLLGGRLLKDWTISGIPIGRGRGNISTNLRIGTGLYSLNQTYNDPILGLNTPSNYNTFYGINGTGLLFSGGSYNTIAGSGILTQGGVYSRNTIFGSNISGFEGDNDIFIGHGVGGFLTVTGQTTSSNILNIGNAITGKGLTGTPSSPKGIIGIGTSANLTFETGNAESGLVIDSGIIYNSGLRLYQLQDNNIGNNNSQNSVLGIDEYGNVILKTVSLSGWALSGNVLSASATLGDTSSTGYDIVIKTKNILSATINGQTQKWDFTKEISSNGLNVINNSTTVGYIDNLGRLGSSVITTKTFTITSGGTYTVDGTIADVVLNATSATTLSLSTPTVTGVTVVRLWVSQASNLVVLPPQSSTVKWNGGVVPTLSITGVVDVITFAYNSTLGKWACTPLLNF